MQNNLPIPDKFGSQWKVMQDPEKYQNPPPAELYEIETKDMNETFKIRSNLSDMDIAGKVGIEKSLSDLEAQNIDAKLTYTIPINISVYGIDDEGHWQATVDYINNEDYD